MSSFEYLSVFVAVIMGLAVTRLLGAVGSCLRQRDSIEEHWVLHVVWMIIPPVGLLTANRRVHAMLPTVFLLSMAVYVGWGILFLAG